MRRLVRETTLRPHQLVLPVFVKQGATEPLPIAAMPGVVQHGAESLRKAAADAVAAGVGGIMLFGVPTTRDATGSGATDPDGVLNAALRTVRAEVGDDIVIMADTCLDEFTDHGHCGLLDATGGVDNDATLAVYAEMAVAQIRAGAHLVGLSGMMDGQVGVMVKPAMCYLDVLQAVAEVSDVPVAAYQVSGEYSMVEAAVAQGWLDRRRAVVETLISIRRAGADLVLTYWAVQAAGWLR
jgi:delta-aminolevulinic acid dehydratase/porphobilinogen synthase